MHTFSKETKDIELTLFDSENQYNKPLITSTAPISIDAKVEPTPSPYNKLGITFSLLTPFVYVVGSCLAKSIPNVPPVQVVLLRALLTTPPVYFYFRYNNRVDDLKKNFKNKPLFMSGFFAAMSSALFYIAMQKLSISEVNTIFSSYAIISGILGALILHEPYSRNEKICGAISFLGVILIVRPPILFGGETATASSESNTALSHWFAGILAILSTLSFSFYQIGVRSIRSKVDPLVIVFFTNLNVILWFGSYFVFKGEYKALSFGEYFGCFVFGGTYVLGLLSSSYALKHATVSVVGLLGYSQLVFSLLVDIIFFRAFPSTLTVSGALLIIGSCLWLFTRKMK